MTTDKPAAFVPPAAEGLPLAALDSATEGADRLDASARTPYGRNLLAHALVQLARDGWLHAEAGEGFEPERDRPAPTEEETVADKTPLTVQQLTDIEAAITAYQQHPELGFGCCSAHPVADAGAALLAEVRRLKGQRKYLIGQLAKRDAESGRGDEALHAFLADEPDEETPAAEATQR